MVHGESGKAAARAAGGQHVAGPGDIIAQNRGRTLPKENGSGGMDPRNQGPGIPGHDFAVLRGQSVDQRHGRIEVADLNQPGVGVEDLLDEFPAPQCGQLAGDLFFNGLQLVG